MHGLTKAAEHWVQHYWVEGIKQGPVTTGVGVAAGVVGGVALTVATGGLALAPLASAAAGGAAAGLLGGGLMGNLTRK
ncbi:MAG: hypothetical protein ACKPEO_12755 [Sphaerospermopsis kisseleviana]